MKRPIFIVGEGRSGTTLLRGIISEHPNIWAVRKETNIFVDNWPQANPCFEKYKNNLDNLILAILTSMKRSRRKSQIVLKKKQIDEDIKRDFEEFKASNFYEELKVNNVLNRHKIFDSICRFFCQKNNAQRFVEKTPFHVYCVDKILEFYPDAQIIAMYRDPRAVNSSWIRRDSLKSIIGTSINWSRAMSEIKDLKEKLPETSFKCIRFEDLVSNPKSTLCDLMNWLEEDFYEELLKDQKVNTSFKSEEKQKTGFLLNTLGRWKGLLSKNQVVLINLLTQKYHQYFDIEECKPQISIKEIFVLPFFYINEVLKLVYGKAAKLLYKFFPNIGKL